VAHSFGVELGGGPVSYGDVGRRIIYGLEGHHVFEIIEQGSVEVRRQVAARQPHQGSGGKQKSPHGAFLRGGRAAASTPNTQTQTPYEAESPLLVLVCWWQAAAAVLPTSTATTAPPALLHVTPVLCASLETSAIKIDSQSVGEQSCLE